MPRSTAISRYCDVSVRRFFEGPNAISFEEFKTLDPTILHELSELLPLHRRGVSWFEHSKIMYWNIIRWLGIAGSPSLPPDSTISEIRTQIGNAIYNRDPAFRGWFNRFYNCSKSDRKRLTWVIAQLFELELLYPGFQFGNLPAESIASLENCLLNRASSDVVKQRNTQRGHYGYHTNIVRVPEVADAVRTAIILD